MIFLYGHHFYAKTGEHSIIQLLNKNVVRGNLKFRLFIDISWRYVQCLIGTMFNW